ncbi:hypothetical protein TURU_018013 [Turdus rufiventris]|nr:hypothetical protein TURU_018013 [Turdus rufiventris]
MTSFSVADTSLWEVGNMELKNPCEHQEAEETMQESGTLILSWLILAAGPDEKLKNERDAQRKTVFFPERVCIMEATFDYIVPLLMLNPVPKNRNPINKGKAKSQPEAGAKVGLDMSLLEIMFAPVLSGDSVVTVALLLMSITVKQPWRISSISSRARK